MKTLASKLFAGYVLIGIYNTAFGILSFSFLYYLFKEIVHYQFLVVLGNVLAVTNAFIAYKLFLFKGKGNLLHQYLKFYSVYLGVFAVSFLLFPVFMELILPYISRKTHWAYISKYDGYIAQLCITGVTMFVSFFGHKNISFKENEA